MQKILITLLSTTLLLAACTQSSKKSQLPEPEQQARVYVDSAMLCIDRHNLKAAMAQLKQAEQLIPELDSAKTIFNIYQRIGWINENSGANELALQYQNRALKYAKTYGKPEHIVEVLVNKANTFFNMNLPDSALIATKTAMKYYHKVGRGLQSAIQKHLARYDLLRDSLAPAEHHAYQAFMLAQDSSALGNALTLLSQIYGRKKQPEKVRLVMSMMSEKGNSAMTYNRLLAETHLHETRGDYRKAYESMLRLKAFDDSLYSSKARTDIIKVKNDYDNAVLQLNRARQRYRYSVVIIALMLLLFILSYWDYRRNRLLYKQFQEQIADFKDELHTQLSARSLTIEEMKQATDSRLKELEQLKRKLPPAMQADRNYESVAQAKLGIDVLDAILRNGDISQFGKREQVAVNSIMPHVDAELAELLNNRSLALTPKETFFCIMERNGMADSEKAKAFCCSEQAVRTAKSQLTKKLRALPHRYGTAAAPRPTSTVQHDKENR